VTLTAPLFFELSGFSALGNHLIFVAWDRAQGQELWISDGTGAGTRPLTSLPRAYAFYDPDSYYGDGVLPLPQFSLGKRFLFRADDGVHGAELWTTDGTPKGTRMVKDLCPGSCGGAASHLVALGGRVLFTGTDGSHGLEPWSSDGTAAGTRMIRDLCAGNSCSAPGQWRTGQGKAFFVRRDEGPSPVPQLWSTDGTASGTARLTSYTWPGVAEFNLQGTFLGAAFLFTANDPAFGAEPWISNGTPRGTRLVADVNVTDTGGSRPSDLKSAAGKAYFLADDGMHGRGSLWVSDGTEAGTSFLAAPFAGEESPYSDPPSIAAAVELGGRIFFTLAAHSNSPGTGGDFSLWRSDGTPEGTVRLMAETGSELAVLGDRIFFVANDGIHGWELWVTDGTAAGARMVIDLDPVDQYGGSTPGSFTVFKDRLYFRATTGKTGYELWRTDGTPEGTVLAKGLETPPFAGSVFPLAEYAGRLYFTAPDAHFVYSLWTTDGTAAGTLPLDLTPGPERLVPTFIVPVGARFFLVGESFSADGTEKLDQGLWISDGTAAGTKRLAGARLESAALGKPFVFKGAVYFGTSFDGNLWKSDGTDAGTAPLLTHDGQPIVHPFTFQLFAGRLFFTTYNQGWLYETDGTPAGTRKVAEMDGDPGSYEFFALAPAGSRLLFRSWDRDHGAELWGVEAE
jgi:ELWxxDGT repeat protein